ncbi:unnamed protein product [Lactuca saligna]|uniref:Disease resistance protein Roq1-like winged-helix domain-containing protein n=1 Tax=Lactuca saligna TaxID=75948 RepID=A0AA35YDF1_LACSI|nr:unnamed protein product [Lactuca saligna]
MSFDSLPSKNDKELFKHISCFFVGIERDFTETILEACDINTRSGITNLIDRCLLSIGWNNELKMHQLVQEMGRFEVRQESPDKPWKRSRIWSHKESFRVLKQKKGKGNLLGLTFDMRMLEKEKLCASFELKTDAFNNMDMLRILQLNYVHMNGSYENFPIEIRWMCMHGLGEFDQLPTLERLIVRNCIDLVENSDMDMLKNVKTMLLDGCSLGESRIQNRDTDSLELCMVNNIDINTRTTSSSFVGAIPSDME